MNFFQAQENARSSTFRLLVMFGMAILTLVLITDLAVFMAFGYMQSELGSDTAPKFSLDVFLLVSGAVLMVIGLGSMYKSMVLSSGGGRTIAESMGGRLVLPATNDTKEKRLMNVVEEMAIASGMPVPQVYILDNETAINAFAAGLTTGDAVIGVTRGTVDSLSRDELQGVIAHEYSHILNGDMALNIKLIGILHGILVLGIIGYYIVRATGRSRSSKDSGGIVILGFALMAIGYGGTFFGNLIKSSVSRQREYLADASAVQFTRNPEGIAGALKKIGGMHGRSLLKSKNAPEMSHAYFSQGITNFLGSLTATHPPLTERIRRIEPQWDGEYITSIKTSVEETQEKETKTDDRREKVTEAIGSAVVLQSVLQSLQHMGNPGEQQIKAARSIINAIPEAIRSGVHDPHGARAVIYCMLINKEEAVRNSQLNYIQKNGDYGIYDSCQTFLPLIDEIPRRCRLPLLDMALPSLRELSINQYDRFKRNLEKLIAADSSMDLFEWSLQKILCKHLDEAFFPAKPASPKHSSYAEIKEHCQLMLTVLAYAGHKNQDDASKAYDEAIKVLELTELPILERSAISLTKFDESLEQLALLKPLFKENLIKACITCAMSDEKMTARELELTRAIADTLNCPIPPII